VPRACFDFNDHVAIVTGGTRGIGGAVSSSLLASGATVVAVYHGDEAAALAFRDAQGESAARLVLEKLDVADPSAVEAFFQRQRTRCERLDLLVNAAGIRRDAVLAMMPETDWRRVLDVNLTGTWAMCKYAVKEMLSRRYGRIVNITSPSGQLGFAGQANYAASKAGQVALTRSLAKEVARRGITVNCVSPGFIDTALIADLPTEQAAAYRELVPLRRFGTPAEVADVVLFLCSDSATYITGSVYDVSGGLS
jgi:3-oxoacyl-[acyl-carrier protein] reductase